MVLHRPKPLDGASHALPSRVGRLLYFIVMLLFTARLCQADCIPTDTTKLPNQQPNQDALALLLKAQDRCPLSTLDFLNLVESSGARLEPTMVNFQGFNDPDDGNFFLFEIVSGQLAGAKVARGDFLFGHFLGPDPQDPSHLTLLTDGLLIEAVAWDPSKQMFNFYELTVGCKPPGANWCYRGDSSFVLQDIEFLDRQNSGQGPFHNQLRCSGCHLNGALIQKELTSPHNDWWTTSRPLSQGSLTPDDTVRKIFQRLVDADELAKLVRAGTQRLAASPEYRKALQKRSMQEQLRPLFCAVELNIESDTNPSDDRKPTIQIPSGFFVDPRLGESAISIARANYDQAVKQHGLQLPPNRTDADHPWLTPVKANSDMMMVNGLVEMGVIDDEFVADVLAVDFTNPLFSTARCGLLPLVPDKGGADFVARFRTALKASSTPAAKELLDNLTDPKRDAKFHHQQVADYLNACQKRASQPEAASEWLDVLAQRRAAVDTDEFSKHSNHQHISESPGRVVFPVPSDSGHVTLVGLTSTCEAR
jgi:hypothetical protein